MNAQELYRAGRLGEALKVLSAEVRDNPTEARRRTFLFELLCFAGEYARADKQLEVLAQAGPETEIGVLLYRNTGEYPNKVVLPERGGVINGKSFKSFADADPRIGARLELFAAGTYLLLPFEHIASIHIMPPKRLRDLLWTPAAVRTTPSFKGTELGEVLLPALSPFSWRHSDEAVRLGRSTVWELSEGYDDQIPFGQKMWLADDEEIPFLELRSLEFKAAPVAV
jgi:type VI secretion system protein ImpE